MRIVGLLLSMLFVFSGGLAEASQAPFTVEVIDAPSEVILGLPAHLDLRIRNRSGEKQNFPFFSMKLHLELVSHPEGPDWWFQDIFKKDGFRVGESPEGPKTVAPSWETFKMMSFVFPTAGAYTVKATLEAEPSGRWSKVYGEMSDHWVGKVFSEPVRVVVKEPEGIDAETFEAVCAFKPEDWSRPVPPARCYRIAPWRMGQPTDARRLLLTKYLDSTYASYEIYTSYRNNWIWKLESYEQTGNLGNIWGYTQCTPSALPDPGMTESRKLTGKDYLRCQEQWLQIALENHPDIWFADDIRLILAGDAYLLGDRDRCRSLLEYLVEKGRPSVAAKARDLLDRMIEKGMLPAPTPKPGFTGETAQ